MAHDGVEHAQLFELDVADNDFHAASAAQMFGELFGEIDGPMLAARATETHHQILEATLLVILDRRINERKHAGQELVNALLLVEVINDRRVAAGERFEALFPARVRKPAAIEDEAAAVAGLILGQVVVKRKTENAGDEIVGLRGDAL